MRLGVFGGTFDPVHIGHLAAASEVRHALALDRVLLVVANVPWQKAGLGPVSPAPDRLAMVEAAARGVRYLEASDLEMRRGGDSYTADTLSELSDAHPGAELYLIVGADVAAELDTWARADEVRRLARLVVVKRPGASALVPSGWRPILVDVPALDLSSTDLRARVAEGRPIDFLVPPDAVRVIRERGLYAGGG